MYHVGETVTPPTDRERPRGPCRFPPAELSNDRLRAIPEKIRSFRNAPQPAWQGLVTVPRCGTSHRQHRLVTAAELATYAHPQSHYQGLTAIRSRWLTKALKALIVVTGSGSLALAPRAPPPVPLSPPEREIPGQQRSGSGSV